MKEASHANWRINNLGEEMALVISPTRNQFSLRKSAHRFRQGGRDVYYFTLDLETLDGLLPQRVEPDVVKDANRRLTPSHARNIQRYLDEEDDWLLGALMLGIAPDAVEFDPYSDAEGEMGNPNFGELRIRSSRVNTMRIFDGQHRRRAIEDVLSDLSSTEDKERIDKWEALRKASMTIVLYAEDNIRTLRQMFVDASKTKRIEGNVVTRFDQRDAFNLAANWIEEKSLLFSSRVELERASVSRTSQRLIAINQLAAVLKILEVGHRGRVSRDSNESYMQDLNGLYKRCLELVDEFMVAAREEYQWLASGEIDNSEIPQMRSTTLAYNVTVIKILAGCYHYWMEETADWQPLARFLRSASLMPGYNPGTLLVDAGIVSPDGRLFSRRQEVEGASRYIVKAAREASQRPEGNALGWYSSGSPEVEPESGR